MEFRIDVVSDGPETVVHIAGRLSGLAIGQLREACEQIEGAVVLDLSNILFADDEAIDFIRQLKENGAEVRKASPFIRLLFDDAPYKKTDG